MSAPSARVRQRVEFPDTDASGHVHNSFAARCFESAEAELLRGLGLIALMPAMPRVRSTYAFRRRLWFGDVVDARVEVHRVGRTSITYGFAAECDGRVAIDGEVVAVHAPGGRAAPWPAEARAALAPSAEVTADVLGTRFRTALGYAADVHAGQRRKGTDVPYISHLLAVAGLAIEDGADEDVAIAALLHDAAEDQGGRERLEDIRRRFGDRVAGIVEACSDTFETPKPPWRARKEAHLRHLQAAPPEVLQVALADKLHNARTILADYRVLGDALWDRFTPGADPLWHQAALRDLFLARRPGPRADELARVVDELIALAAPAPAAGGSR